VAKGVNNGSPVLYTPGRGRTWWARLEFTRRNIDEPTILPKKVEDLREAGASKSIAR
jgi:hypothetical protein